MNSFHKDALAILLCLSVLFIAGCAAAQPAATAEPAEEDNGQTIAASGEIVPARWVTLSVSAAGNVESLNTSEGEYVDEGAVLLQLSGKDLRQAEVAAAELEQLKAQQTLDDLYRNNEIDRAAAYQMVVQYQQDIDDAIKKRTNQEFERSDRDTLDKAMAEYRMAIKKVSDAEQLYDTVDHLPADDVNRNEVLVVLSTAREERSKKLVQLNWLLGRPDALDIAITEADIGLADARLQDAERQWNELAAGPDPDDLLLAHARLKNAENQLASARFRLEDLELKAPFTGTVSQVDVRADEWVAAGQPLLLLADLSTLQVETTDLNEIDAARVHEGDAAAVTFDAFPGTILNGTVTRISPKSSRTTGVNYTAVIQLASIPDRLRWGMTAFVDIQPQQ